MQIEILSIDRLSPARYNPRKPLMPGDKAYEQLKRSIQSLGYVEPIIWNKQTGHVVGGHQRLRVMTDLGYKEVHVSVVDLSDEDEAALNLALNKISGEWDEDKLAALLDDLRGAEVDIHLTGFDAAEIDALLGFSSEFAEDDLPFTDVFEEEEADHVTACPTCGARQNGKKAKRPVR